MKHKFLFLSCLCICTMLIGIVGLLMAKTNDQCLNFVYLSTISALVGVISLVLDNVEQKRIK
jgi:hypothetical protein